MKRAEIIKLLNRAVIGVTSPNDFEHKELEVLIDDLKAGSVMLQNDANAEAMEKYLPQRKDPISAVHLAWFGDAPTNEGMDMLQPYIDAIVGRGGDVHMVPSGVDLNETDVQERLKNVGADSNFVIVVVGPPAGREAMNASLVTEALIAANINRVIHHNFGTPPMELIVRDLVTALRHIPGVPELTPRASSDLSAVLSSLSTIQKRLDIIEHRQIAAHGVDSTGVPGGRLDQTRGWNPPGGSVWDFGKGQAGFLNPGMLPPRGRDAYGAPVRSFWSDQRFGMPNQNQTRFAESHDPYPARGAMASKQVQIVRLYPMMSVGSVVMNIMKTVEPGLNTLNRNPAAPAAFVFELYDTTDSLQGPVAVFGAGSTDPSWKAIPSFPSVLVTSNVAIQPEYDQTQKALIELGSKSPLNQPSVLTMDEFIRRMNDILAPVFGQIPPGSY